MTNKRNGIDVIVYEKDRLIAFKRRENEEGKWFYFILIYHHGTFHLFPSHVPRLLRSTKQQRLWAVMFRHLSERAAHGLWRSADIWGIVRGECPGSLFGGIFPQDLSRGNNRITNVAVMTCATLVNAHTDRQLLTAYTISSANEIFLSRTTANNLKPSTTFRTTPFATVSDGFTLKILQSLSGSLDKRSVLVL